MIIRSLRDTAMRLWSVVNEAGVLSGGAVWSRKAVDPKKKTQPRNEEDLIMG